MSTTDNTETEDWLALCEGLSGIISSLIEQGHELKVRVEDLASFIEQTNGMEMSHEDFQELIEKMREHF